jgi:glycosyltransferase involved in cell wall biosynthesis
VKISVLTPSFNSGKYLERAIKSTLNQNYSDWEHIIVDGESTDNTIEILKKYDHLKWVSEKDNGQSDAMNKAFALATGDVIVYLNADDEIALDTFSFVTEIFGGDSKIDAVFGDLNCRHTSHDFYAHCSISLDDIVNINNDLCFPLNPVAYYYRRHVQKKIGLFPPEEHMAMDYWFLLRLYKEFKIEYKKRVFGIYHITGENKSIDVVKSRTGLNTVLRDFIYEFNLHKYDCYLNDFTFLNLKNAFQYTALYNELNIKQNSLKYLLKRIWILVKLKIQHKLSKKKIQLK